MQPPERLERRIIQCLHAQRDAIDAGRAKAAKARRLDAGRVGFEAHFDIAGYRPVPGDGVKDRTDGCGLHQRRRAAAEEDRGDGSSG